MPIFGCDLKKPQKITRLTLKLDDMNYRKAIKNDISLHRELCTQR